MISIAKIAGRIEILAPLDVFNMCLLIYSAPLSCRLKWSIRIAPMLESIKRLYSMDQENNILLAKLGYETAFDVR
jgi:hypothetical protein